LKSTIILLFAIAVLASAASASRPFARGTSTSASLLRLPRATRGGEQTLWGHVKSLTRKGGRWELKFDPGLLLFGAAAEQAAFEDTGSRDVPNDAYTVEESHRLFTYVVSPRASVSILTKGLETVKIGVPEFAKILRGKNPNHRRLFGQPRSSGFWIRVGFKYPNPVLAIDEQYHP
jgi:hypothetical protein